MELSYTLSARDLQAFARYWSAQRATHHKKRYTVVPAALILAAGLTMLLFPSGFFDLGFNEVVAAILPPLAIFVVICIIGNMLHREMVSKTFHGLSHVRMADDGIHHGDEHTDSRTRWEALRKFVETADHLFLIYGYQQAVIIPKSQVDEADQQAVKDTVAAHRPELLSA